MAKTPSPLHTKRIPKSVSVPTLTAEAAATVAESAVAPGAVAKPPKVAKVAKAATKAQAAAKVAPKVKAAAKAAPEAKVAPEAAPKAKAAAKPAARPAAKSPETATVLADKPAKAHKPKLVRDSFTIPKDEYQVLEALKARALGLETHVRKSELLRAGIQVLDAMNDKAFLKALGAVPTLKTGRPKAD